MRWLIHFKMKYTIGTTVCLCAAVFMFFFIDKRWNFDTKFITGSVFQKEEFLSGASKKVHFESLDKLYNKTDRSKLNGKWVEFGNPLELYAYSAFYDNRTSLRSFPIVRVIIVTEASDDTSLYCQLYYNSRNRLAVIAERLKIGFGVTRHGKRFREYVLSCRLDNFADIPANVSVGTSENTKPDRTLSIEVPPQPNTKRDFAVCVSVCYGKEWDVYKIIEWMELLKIIGVSKVGIYNNTLGSEASRIFQYYDSHGFVDFRQSWNFLSDPGVLTSHLHWSPVINDCIYRNMYSFNKIIVIDLDEIILPKNVYNLSQLLLDIDKNQVQNDHPARSYTFRNDYFFYDIRRKDDSMPKYIKMLTHRWRLPPSNQGYSAKSIISPLACTHMHNHYCWGYTKQYLGKGHHVEVEPRFAVNQHYKKCHFSRGECERLLVNITQDDTILKYKDKLITAVDSVLKDLSLLPIN